MATNSTEADLRGLLPPHWQNTVAAWLQEDVPSFDYAGYVVGSKHEIATLYCKDSGVLAGVPFFEEVFKLLDCTVEWKRKEGEYIDLNGQPRVEVAKVTGTARQLLAGERTALNILARASGIATRASGLAKLKEEKNWHGMIAGTRKTTPGFRLVEKYAILVGGVDTHRMDLSSMIMLKDNHVWSQGSITNAVKRAKSVGGFALKVEVECRSIEEAQEAIDAGADVVMLDNFKPSALKEAAKALKSNPRNQHALIEASGGITVESIAEYFTPDIDILSMGSLTQGVPFIDFSLKIDH